MNPKWIENSYSILIHSKYRSQTRSWQKYVKWIPNCSFTKKHILEPPKPLLYKLFHVRIFPSKKIQRNLLIFKWIFLFHNLVVHHLTEKNPSFKRNRFVHHIAVNSPLKYFLYDTIISSSFFNTILSLFKIET